MSGLLLFNQTWFKWFHFCAFKIYTLGFYLSVSQWSLGKNSTGLKNQTHTILKHVAGPWLLFSHLFCLKGSAMQQMGERKQPSPDLFIAQKTIAFTLCFYNPCFPASAKDPDKDETNKMPVGGPSNWPPGLIALGSETPGCLASPLLLHKELMENLGERNLWKTGRGTEPHTNSTSHPKVLASGTCTQPRCSAKSGCSSATCRNLSTRHGAAWAPWNSSPLWPAMSRPYHGGARALWLMSAAQCAWKGTEVCRPGAGKIRLELYLSLSAHPPYRSWKHVSTGTILTNTERRDEKSLSIRQERWLVSWK